MKEIAGTPYGSDATGLIWGYRIGPGSAAQIISAQEAHSWLTQTEAYGRRIYLAALLPC